MSAPTIFADYFEIRELGCTRRASRPEGRLLGTQVHHQMDLPFDAGRATLDIFHNGASVFARLVGFKTGEVAWYDVKALPAAASPSRPTTEPTP